MKHHPGVGVLSSGRGSAQLRRHTDVLEYGVGTLGAFEAGSETCFIGVFSLLVAVWAAHPEADRPTSVTTIGLSRPGVGAGIYNGLRAKSIPAVTELSRLEQQASEPQSFSVRGADLIQ